MMNSSKLSSGPLPPSLPGENLGKGNSTVSSGTAGRKRFTIPKIQSPRLLLVVMTVSVVVVLLVALMIWPFTFAVRPGQVNSTLTVGIVAGTAIVSEANAAQYQMGDGRPVSMRQGMKLAGGQNIRITALTSRVVLTLSDGTLIYIGPQSTIILSELVDQTQGIKATQIALQRGMVYLSGQGATFQVTAVGQPNWYAEVRGSKMGVNYNGIDSFVVDCFEGDCTVNEEGNSLQLASGKGGGIKGKLLSEVRLADFAFWQALAELDALPPIPETGTPSPLGLQTPTFGFTSTRGGSLPLVVTTLTFTPTGISGSSDPSHPKSTIFPQSTTIPPTRSPFLPTNKPVEPTLTIPVEATAMQTVTSYPPPVSSTNTPVPPPYPPAPTQSGGEG